MTLFRERNESDLDDNEKEMFASERGEREKREAIDAQKTKYKHAKKRDRDRKRNGDTTEKGIRQE